MNIKVEKIKELDGAGNLKALASINIGGKLKIHCCRIIQQLGQAAWVSLPQIEWTDRGGTKRYFPAIELPQRVKDAIQEAVLAAWKRGQND